MPKKLIAYVRFESGAIHTESVVDRFGKFVGTDLYFDEAAATMRWPNVRQIEITIGKRVKEYQPTYEPGKATEEELGWMGIKIKQP